jgi:PAS domain S-box-containing protein
MTGGAIMMTQRKKIAFAYLFAVPVVLVIVLFQYGALFRVSSDAGGLGQAAEVLHESDAAISLLKDAEADAQRYVASGGDDVYRGLYQDAVSQLRNVLRHLQELTHSDPSTQQHLLALDPLVANRTSLFQQAMDLGKKGGPSVQDRTALERQGQKLTDDIGKIIADIKTAQFIRLQQQKETVGRSVRVADVLTTYGGILVIWIVGVAAFLLFHDEKKRVWDGMERRIPSKVLQTLPLGVCVTTDSGLILYANPAEEAVFGYDPGELVGKNVTLLHAPDGVGADRNVSAIFERLESAQIWSGEIPIVKKDGTTHKTGVWIMNMEVPGKLYRVVVHNYYTE